MATQGLVEIYDGDKLRIKIIAGCNGCNAAEFVDKLKAGRINLDSTPLIEIYRMAEESDFGCRDCLVVMDGNSEWDYIDGYLPPLYREKFSVPGFNPRWERGTVEHYEKVDL